MSYSAVQVVNIALTVADIIDVTVSATIAGIALTALIAASELFVRKETVPIKEVNVIREHGGDV